MLTRQEIFDKVKKHLLTQGKRAKNDAFCLYRGPDNTKCAAGCLIKDEYYSPQLEKYTVNNTIVIRALEQSGVSLDDIVFISRLQMIHDQNAPEYWERQLSLLAKEFDLKEDV